METTNTPDNAGRRSRLIDLGIALLFGVATFFMIEAFLLNVQAAPTIEDDLDGLQLLSFARASFDAFSRFGEYPMWNPYFGGGVPWQGYIYHPDLTVMGVVYSLLEPLLALRVLTFIALWLASWGMYATARWWMGLTRPAALFAGLCYLCSRFFADQWDSGNYDLLTIMLLPVASALLWQLLEGKWPGLLLPVLYQHCFAQAKYAPFIFAMMMFVLAVYYGWGSRKKMIWAVGAWGVSFVVGCLLALPKLLPLLEWRAMDLVDQTQYSGMNSFKDFWQIFAEILGRLEAGGADEGSIALGAFVLILAVLGPALSWKRSIPWLFLFFFSCWWGLGEESPVPLAEISQRLPLFGTMNSFQKYFTTSIILSLCALAALGFDTVLARVAELKWMKRWPWLPTVIAVIAIAGILRDQFGETGERFEEAFEGEIQQVEQAESFHHVAESRLLGKYIRYRFIPETMPRSYDSETYHVPLSGRGLITWYGNFAYEENARAKYLYTGFEREENPEYLGELYTAPDGSGGVTDYEITYNTISFEIDEPLGDSLAVVNQNHSPYWSAEQEGLEVVEHDGLIAVRAPADYAGPVELRYSLPRFWYGLVGAALTALLWFGGWPWTRRLRPTEDEGAESVRTDEAPA